MFCRVRVGLNLQHVSVHSSAQPSCLTADFTAESVSRRRAQLPIEWTDRLNADLGVFAQDAWTLKRPTVNVGARWEYFNSEVSASASTSPAGRFVPTRSFDTITMPAWKDVAPRFGVVYDLFGAKTAIKLGLNRYKQAQTINFADQLDVSLAKWFQIGATRVQGQFDVFNALNRSDVLSVRSLNFGTASYMQPSSVLVAS
jgi:hypothetical protein